MIVSMLACSSAATQRNALMQQQCHDAVKQCVKELCTAAEHHVDVEIFIIVCEKRYANGKEKGQRHNGLIILNLTRRRCSSLAINISQQQTSSHRLVCSNPFLTAASTECVLFQCNLITSFVCCHNILLPTQHSPHFTKLCCLLSAFFAVPKSYLVNTSQCFPCLLLSSVAAQALLPQCTLSSPSSVSHNLHFPLFPSPPHLFLFFFFVLFPFHCLFSAPIAFFASSSNSCTCTYKEKARQSFLFLLFTQQCQQSSRSTAMPAGV